MKNNNEGNFKYRYRYKREWLNPEDMDWILQLESKDCESNYVYMDWVRVRQVLEHEDYLLIERAKLLLAVQTILSAMIYFSIKDGISDRVFPALVCLFGVLMSGHLAFGMYKAKIHQNKVIDWWFSRVGFQSKRGRKRLLRPLFYLLDKLPIQVEKEDSPRIDLPSLMKRQPPIAGKDPGIDRTHWSVPYWGIGGMFFILWLFGLIVFCMELPLLNINASAVK